MSESSEAEHRSQVKPGNAQDVAKPSALAATGKQLLPFVIGGASGIVGTTCVQPIDMVKVRLQLLGEGAAGKSPSPLRVARNIVAQDGFFSLYNGISAAWLRQASYATLRLGFFDRFLAYATTQAASHNRSVTFSERSLASLSAGGLAAALANPAEVALIRLQSDGMKPAAERANYRSVVDALLRITRCEGVKALWSGAYPTIVRAMATNFGQLAFFSEAKHQLRHHTSFAERKITVLAAGVAGVAASVLGLPFDFLKTRLQRGGARYAGMWDCAAQVWQREGAWRFYRGFGTYFLRIAPHTIVTLIVADNVTSVARGKGLL